jgi:hypothetical protein
MSNERMLELEAKVAALTLIIAERSLLDVAPLRR